MKKWHLGGFVGCLIAGGALVVGLTLLVGLLLNPVNLPGEWILVIGSTLFFLIVVAGLLTGLVCQGNCIDELELRIRKLEEKLKEKTEEE